MTETNRKIDKQEITDHNKLKDFFSDVLPNSTVTPTPAKWHYDAQLYIQGKHNDGEYTRIETKSLKCGYKTYKQWVLNHEKTIPLGSEERQQNADIFIEFFSDGYVAVTSIKMIYQMYMDKGEIECMWEKEVKKTEYDSDSTEMVKQKQYVFRHSTTNRNRMYLNKYYKLFKYNNGKYERVYEQE